MALPNVVTVNPYINISMATTCLRQKTIRNVLVCRVDYYSYFLENRWNMLQVYTYVFYVCIIPSARLILRIDAINKIEARVKLQVGFGGGFKKYTRLQFTIILSMPIIKLSVIQNIAVYNVEYLSLIRITFCTYYYT